MGVAQTGYVLNISPRELPSKRLDERWIAANLTLTPKKSVSLLSFGGSTTRLQGVWAFFSAALPQTRDSALRLRISLLLRSFSV